MLLISLDLVRGCDALAITRGVEPLLHDAVLRCNCCCMVLCRGANREPRRSDSQRCDKQLTSKVMTPVMRSSRIAWRWPRTQLVKLVQVTSVVSSQTQTNHMPGGIMPGLVSILYCSWATPGWAGCTTCQGCPLPLMKLPARAALSAYLAGAGSDRVLHRFKCSVVGALCALDTGLHEDETDPHTVLVCQRQPPSGEDLRAALSAGSNKRCLCAYLLQAQ